MVYYKKGELLSMSDGNTYQGTVESDEDYSDLEGRGAAPEIAL